MAKAAVRPIRIEGKIAYITLTRGFVAVIDAADVPLIEGRSWHADQIGRAVYAVSNNRKGERPRRTYLHRAIAGGASAAEVDHEDGDGLNCRRSNLRLATHQENSFNRGPNRNNTSGVKGVWFRRDTMKWAAEIKASGRKISLGSYDTIEAAAAARAKASREHHGDFAHIR